MKSVFETHLEKGAELFGINMDGEQRDKFADYFEAVLKKNRQMNLTAITEPKDFALKHVIDSLSGYDPRLFPQGAKVIDVGTGAGFPGIPLKIMHNHLELYLLDSLEKRLLFLEEVCKMLSLENVRLLHMRAEDGGRDKKCRAHFDVAVSRAVSRLSVLAEFCLPFVKIGGFFIAWKGRNFEEETAEAQNAIKILGGAVREIRHITLPGIDDKRAVIVIEKVSPTPKEYPRRAGTPQKKPL